MFAQNRHFQPAATKSDWLHLTCLQKPVFLNSSIYIVLVRWTQTLQSRVVFVRSRQNFTTMSSIRSRPFSSIRTEKSGWNFRVARPVGPLTGLQRGISNSKCLIHSRQIPNYLHCSEKITVMWQMDMIVLFFRTRIERGNWSISCVVRAKLRITVRFCEPLANLCKFCLCSPANIVNFYSN